MQLKTNTETEVLFIGDVPGFGKTALLCVYNDGIRTYYRLTGNITKFNYQSCSIAPKGSIICSYSTINMEVSNYLCDIDCDTFSTLDYADSSFIVINRTNEVN